MRDAITLFFHVPLYGRHLYPGSFPYKEGVCQRLFMTSTMPAPGEAGLRGDPL